MICLFTVVSSVCVLRAVDVYYDISLTMDSRPACQPQSAGRHSTDFAFDVRPL